VSIYTTAPGATYRNLTGTSASSAIVAGVAAFMKAVDPSLTNGIIIGRLARSADTIGTSGDPNNQLMFGNGRINMANAVADASTLPVQPAGVSGSGPYQDPYTAATGSVTVATGGSAIWAGTAGNGGNGTFTTLTGPSIAETNNQGMPAGSMILTAPSGYEFDTSANSVTVTVTGTGTLAQINTTATTTGQGTSKTVTPTATTITIWITTRSQETQVIVRPLRGPA